MKTLRYVKCLALGSLAAAAALFTLIFLAAEWTHKVFGEEVWWNMSTGHLESRIFFLGVQVNTREEQSGAERLFDPDTTSRPELPVMVFKRPLLQPRRGVDNNSGILSLAKTLCESERFEKVVQTNAEVKTEIKRWVLDGKKEELSNYLESLFE